MTAADSLDVSQFAALLNELSDAQRDLLALLQEKRSRMIARDGDEMLAMQAREEALADRLQAVQTKRAAMLEAAAAKGLPGDSLTALASALPGARRRELTKQTEDAAARMRRLQQESLVNWVLAQRSLLHIAQVLEFVAMGGRSAPTYGEGTSASALDRGNLVDDAG